MTVAVWLLPPYVAVIVTAALADPLRVAIAKLCDVEPAGMVTDGGTIAVGELLASAITAPEVILMSGPAIEILPEPIVTYGSVAP